MQWLKPPEQHFLESEEIQFITSGFDKEIPPIFPFVKREVLTLDTLEEQAKSSAAKHQIGRRPSEGISLKRRLKSHEKALKKSFFALSRALDDEGEKLSSGSEWLIDNFHVLEQHIKTVENYLSMAKTKEFPQITDGPFKGFPRVWVIAYELVKYSDASIDDELLKRYMKAYQSQVSLTMKELWAFPSMLRIVLIERLAHLAMFNVLIRKQSVMADRLLENVFSDKSPSPSETLIHFAKVLKDSPEYWSNGCLVHLILELKNLGSKGSLCLKWLNQRIEEHDLFANTLVEQVVYIDSSIQILISNIFADLRTIATYDWISWFEEVSHVHQVLLKDPAHVYPKCDSRTCEHYRNKIEILGQSVDDEEREIAEKAITLCSSSPYKETTGVGHFLVGEGVLAFEKELNYRPNIWERLGRHVEKKAFSYWLSGSLACVLGFLSLPAYWLFLEGYGVTASFFILIPFFVIASEASIQLIQWFIAHVKKPKFLARFDFEEEIPQSCTTLVVLHIVLTSRRGIQEAVNSLESQLLSNRCVNLHFALVCDRAPSRKMEIPLDLQLIDYAQQLVSNVIHRWEKKVPSKLFLITRSRTWSESEGRYICWERKRGKIHQLNRLILGNDVKGIDVNIGDMDLLKTVQFVITLDEDVKIPPGTAYKIVGTIAHPLNRPIVDPKEKRVKKGYGIIQPLMKTSLTKAFQTPLTRILSESPGADPYTYLVSSMHQDLFLEGIYVGKGAYHVKTFEEVLDQRFPENAILSHDLLEGLFARVGLSTDIYFLEDIPETYTHFSRRLHRWMRGDWQLIPWLFSRVPNAEGERIPTVISPLGRWKILENLRISLLFPAVFLALILNWVSFSPPHWKWLVYLFLLMNFSLVTTVVDLFYYPLRNIRFPWSHLYHGWQHVKKHFQQAVVRVLLIPPITTLSLHAVAISLYRVFYSKKHLLQWNTFNEVKQLSQETIGSLVKEMAGGIVLAFVAFFSLFFLPQPDFLIATPVVIAWLCVPFFVKYLGSFRERPKATLSSTDEEDLLDIAWDTWQYYADLLSEQGHYLMPDNLQLVPKPTLAMRTSPTNIGFQFLSALSAYDFGFLYPTDLIDLYSKALDTIEKLEKKRGHLYNWYSTETLEPLHPRYVSSVDSGNFIGHLLTTRQALLSLHKKEILTPAHWRHFKKCIDIVQSNWRVKPLTFFPPKYLADLFGLFRSLEEWIDLVVGTTRAALPLISTHEEAITQRAVTYILKFAEFGSTFRFIEQFEALLQKVDHLPLIDLDTELKLLTEELHDRYRKLTKDPFPTWLSLLYETKRFTELISELQQSLRSKPDDALVKEAQEASEGLAKELKSMQYWCETFLEKVDRVINQMSLLIKETDFAFLYSPKERLLSIGYHEEKGYIDPNYYAFLASESCISSLVAIAKGDVPSKHWFALGRPLIRSSAGKTLLSWSGSAFEYLMPLILINPPENSLIDVMTRVVVKAQRNYGKKNRLPWGISESGYGVTDREGNYQYKAFGLPELGLKRGLADDYVVSPYSTFLALLVLPREAMKNIKALKRAGARGAYGFFESLDYTPSRLSEQENTYILRSYLTHHQGMILNSINNMLNDGILQKYFQAAALIRSFDLLLQEQFPFGFGTVTLTREHPVRLQRFRDEEMVSNVRQITTPHTRFPCTHVLSNGRLSEMIDNTGSGYLFFEGQDALTRWNPDPLINRNGYHIFIRDLQSGKVWSAGYQPTRVEAKGYEWTFSPHKVEVRRHDDDIFLHMEVTISPEHNVEYRQMTLTNLSGRKREIDITTYGEVVLATLAADQFHLPFSKMFIESRYRESDVPGLIFRRVPKSSHDRELYLMHMQILPACWGKTEWETDRQQFIGRGRSIDNPQAMEGGASLSGTTGFTLDPIFSLREKMVLEPHESETLYLAVGVGRSLEEIEQLMEHVFKPNAIKRAFEMSLAHSQLSTRYEHLPFNKIRLYQAFTNNIFFFLDPWREGRESRLINKLQQNGLWALGISGDLPIVLIRLTNAKQISFLQDLLSAHHYLAKKCVNFDLVILNEVTEGYRNDFTTELENLRLRYTYDTQPSSQGVAGRIFLFNADHVKTKQIALLEACANRIFTEKEDSLLLDYDQKIVHRPIVKRKKSLVSPQTISPEKTEYFNGYGGFIEDGRGYRLFVQPGVNTPQPWVNVIGAEHFGFLISETGGGYTWSENSQQNRLTPMQIDPISDSRGEMLYLRHPQTRRFCSAFPIPGLSDASAIVDHHFGYSKFRASFEKVDYELIVSGAKKEPVKWWRLRLRNTSYYSQELELFLYVEWVLGVLRQNSAGHLLCGYDRRMNFVYAKNPFNGPFSERIAFIGTSEPLASMTTSREEFIGQNRDLLHPIAFEKEGKYIKLDQKVTIGNDSCGVLQLLVSLEPNQEKEVLFYLAEAESIEEASRLAIHFSSPLQWKKEHEKVREFWHEITQTIQVSTPERTFDILMNGWLLYQTLSCRLWARTGFFQCSGAYGFRDQLQDALALLPIDSGYTRRQILLHASRQFIEGDVQHWWNPPLGAGVRTRISDDLLWLPFAVIHYLDATGDSEILDEEISYLKGDILEDEEHEIHFEPLQAPESGTLYQHCVLAIDRSLQVGQHGLPLIHGGDWNDGMNAIGIEGRGESVWLAWFLAMILEHFENIAQERRDTNRAETYRHARQSLLEAIEKEGWDGEWYRRAYFDDGTPLGSRSNDECQIDSISQTWGVISGGAKEERQQKALESVYHHLVNREARLIQLLTPPFDQTELEPGYIKSYPPGIRENGGQYTHAATWVVLATAMRGWGSRAFELFQMINPITHTLDKSRADRYKGEPYVLAGDVYSMPPYEGVAGWTWYTGSAGWLYQTGLTAILGLKVQGAFFTIFPCIPKDWKEYTIRYRWKTVAYAIHVRNPEGVEQGVKKIELEGNEIEDKKIFFPAEPPEDEKEIKIDVYMG
ncbi:MAG: glucoamylase family protein [Waddliaceae bacterium]